MEPRRRPGKTKEIQVISENLKEKSTLLIGDSITKNMERFAPSYPRFFPTSTVLNADIAGAILYGVEVVDIPSSVTHISLFCGTNNLCSHSPATISSTITEILIYYDLSVQLHISIYFQFYHDSINFKNTLLLLTLLFIFRFKNCSRICFFPRTAIHPV